MVILEVLFVSSRTTFLFRYRDIKSTLSVEMISCNVNSFRVRMTSQISVQKIFVASRGLMIIRISIFDDSRLFCWRMERVFSFQDFKVKLIITLCAIRTPVSQYDDLFFVANRYFIDMTEKRVEMITRETCSFVHRFSRQLYVYSRHIFLRILSKSWKSTIIIEIWDLFLYFWTCSEHSYRKQMCESE